MTAATVDLGDLLDGFEGRVAVYARHLGDGREAAVDPDRRLSTGSAAKTLVLAAYCEAAAEGRLDPARRVELTDEWLTRLGSGVLRFCRPGLRPTLDDCAYLMMTVSDNVATDLLLDAVGGPAAVNAVCRRLGLADAEITADTVWVMPPGRFGTASPRHLAGIYAVLADPSDHGYPAAAADHALTIVARHQHLEGFARFLPHNPHAADFGLTPAVRIWSKSGSYPTVRGEAGLFATDRARWVLAVMCDQLTELRSNSTSAALTLVASVAERVHGAWGSP